jgi:hypothetical protein
MAAGRYDITTEQGTTFKLHLRYKDSNSNNVDLANFDSRLQVRRSAEDDQLILWVFEGGVTGPGSTGEFVANGGVAGTGGITMNMSASGATGFTGGILIEVDADTMSNVPAGNHFYDLELVGSTGTVTRLIQGRFSVDREITR